MKKKRNQESLKSSTSFTNDNFSFYLTGLIEGDGTIFVPKEQISAKGKQNYPAIEISFHLKNLPLALIIQKSLGCGSLIRKKGNNCYIYSVNNIDTIRVLVSLLNGKMRTTKVYDLWRLIDWLNIQSFPLNSVDQDVNTVDQHVQKYSLNNQPLVNDAWFSGFIDASGSFSVRATEKQYKIECRFICTISRYDQSKRSKLFFMEQIAQFLLSTVKTTRIGKPNNQYTVRTTSYKGNIALQEYLRKYPLFGCKRLDYQDWTLVLDFFKKEPKNINLCGLSSSEKCEKIHAIKSGMNNSRTVYTWQHLNNFYNLEK